MDAPAAPPTSKLSVLAIVGLVLSVLGAVPLVADIATMVHPNEVDNALATGLGASFTALPGLITSGIALSRCATSRGALRGNWLAGAGILIALFTLFAGVVMLAGCVRLAAHNTIGTP